MPGGYDACVAHSLTELVGLIHASCAKACIHGSFRKSTITPELDLLFPSLPGPFPR